MISGRLVGKRIVVWDHESSRELFGQGYFGKPLGIQKPKGGEFDAPLVMDLIEGLYLAERHLLQILDHEGKKVGLSKIRTLCERELVNFHSKYVVFRDLRDKGYVVAPGIKFGCDFAVYQHGPGIDHAPYLVQVYRKPEEITATGIVLAGRLATTVKKQFILAVPDGKGGRVDYVGFDWFRA